METDHNFIEEIREAIEDGKLTLSSWEEDFLDSIEGQLDYRGNLSKKQRETLDSIHSKIRAW